MAYVGNQPYQAAFVTDTFSGNGSTTAFTMSVAPAGTTSVLVAVTGVLQDPSTYSVSGTTLTFSAAPPSGTGNISVRYLGIPASGVTTTAYRTVTEFTATSNQTTFTPPSYTVGYIDVYRNGVRLGTADYTASNGTTVVLAKGATVGDLVVTESFYVSSVLNAISTSGGTIAGNLTINSASGQSPLVVQANGTYGLVTDSSGNVGVGTASPVAKLTMAGNIVFSGNQALNWNLYTNAGDKYIANGYAAQFYYDPSAGTLRYLNASNNSSGAGAAASTADRFAIDSSGNVLVGTTTQATSALLTVNGSIKGTLTSGTAVTSTSGTSIDFTGIPSWAKRVTVLLQGVSTTGTGTIWLQVGTSSGVETTGYVTTVASISTAANTTNGSTAATAAFPFYQTTIAAADTLTATFVLANINGNTWIGQGSGLQGTRTIINGGSKSLAATLDRVRITTSNGTDTFDAGTINILYEG